MVTLEGKRILLIVTGGIAAFKGLELVRLIKAHGSEVRVILTASGSNFVSQLSLQAITEDKVYTDLFSLTDESEMGHIQLSRNADLILVAPATANLLAKMRAGIADDLASTVLLATDKPVLVAPSMNVRMWEHPATQENIVTLIKRGVTVLGPTEGEMACGEFGAGRMLEPPKIVEQLVNHLSTNRALLGSTVLVTAGPTLEPIDPVRFISNRSSGKQGYAIASVLSRLGAKTTLVTGPTDLADPPGVNVIKIETAIDMMQACLDSLPADIAICAAAVADWRVTNNSPEKIKKQNNSTTVSLELNENPDILKTLSQLGSNRPNLVIGFAAETENLLENAMRKRKNKGCDWILANDVSTSTGVFGGESNLVHFITNYGSEEWPSMLKENVAMRLAERIIAEIKK
ncbi:MAG: bifunctional phosphopantothenoylcysteine decarboxylase/phosphopantothenate--cysteine ligase CoaBC [Rhodospirillaceae bacterium]|jgi:phosphopantothenoylcysteine decarboxylase/phosphopantothenate--cysteine ligase|nr:bifunctional phosphopantothenoylcysteine decarboxylase/phosphopantothenate--cysteine ligase CoaBC [Rhodospirillaceae bacterium]MBT5913964.1 bifunctional phosphopantothenoylcysteine decarboxylase/phosphopantothenate--cysteine ligase CoaBC [Rhodospirillaceae bacterium]MDC0999302.1 bifunctional phosphopantothenoylcysteine decarboxylase/phosphopantothenate--cysteine ligase CoaBC [Alphaproteobacteria bacterium]